MRGLDVVIVGGGPAGLFLARLLRRADPGSRVRVYERHRADEAFGFGVVFSDRAMVGLRTADPETYQRIVAASVTWTDMEIRLRGRRLRYGGYGFTAVSRRALLAILQEQAAGAGAELIFTTEVNLDAVPASADVVAVADGVNSTSRTAGPFGASVEPGAARYVWFGTPARFEVVTFPFVHSRHGAFAAHAYPYTPGMSTFIVETDESTWTAAGFAESTAQATQAGGTDEYARVELGRIFAQHLGGRELVGNNSRWSTFRVVRNEHWSHGRYVLLGDAAHSAHFSVGSGTKMAMEDAITLAARLTGADDIAAAYAGYEAHRRPIVEATQRRAHRSMRWWETFGERVDREPEVFGLHFITRTGAIDHDGLRERHPARIDAAEAAFARAGGVDVVAGQLFALATPLCLGSLRLAHRLVSGRPGPGGLTLLDWRGGPTTPGRSGPVAVMVTPDQLGPGLDRLMGMVPVDFVEVVLGPPEMVDVTAAFKDGTPWAVGFPTPVESAWSAPRAPLVDACEWLVASGVELIHLHGAPGLSCGHLVDWADRIRSISGLRTMVDAPVDRVLARTDGSEPDDWAMRLHTALVTGRIDLVNLIPPVGSG